MSNRKQILLCTLVALGVLAALGVTSAAVQSEPQTAQRKATVEKFKQGTEVKLIGRVVDLQCFMSGQKAKPNALQCAAECIKAGVPAGLETEEGLIVLGQGNTGPAKAVIPFAFQQVEVTGKLYRKGGLKYIDIKTINEATNYGEGSGLHDEEEGDKEQPE